MTPLRIQALTWADRNPARVELADLRARAVAQIPERVRMAADLLPVEVPHEVCRADVVVLDTETGRLTGRYVQDAGDGGRSEWAASLSVEDEARVLRWLLGD